MADKVIGGTPVGTESKCSTCRMAIRMRGLNLQEMVHCQYIGKRVPFQVESCSAYDDKRTPALHEMREIAWNIETRNRGQMGFAAGSNLEIEITPPKKRDGGESPIPFPGVY